ncbi:MAG: Ltp family lipoprotein, partial [Culicoidibacterales bacterium]
SVEETPSVEVTPSATTEQKNALKTAENYLKFTAMSKGGLYDQLIYEQYTAEQAQYAVDTIQTDWNEQALKCAQNYQKIMPMSTGGLYDQLIYEQFTAEQAQYAIDHLATTESASGGSSQNDAVLKTAENYLKFTAMSKGGLYDQLIYEQYTAEQAQYAVDTIQTDWNEQALKCAQNYQKIMPMSTGGLYDQLIYEQFTAEQAQYAIDHLE